MMKIIVFLISLFPSAAFAEFVVASRTIRANAIITELDVRLVTGDLATGYDRIVDVLGQEAKIALYAGRPIFIDAIGPPAVVERNQIVQLKYVTESLRITTEGRALERGAIGDRIRIMNLSSRSTLFGQVAEDGTVEVLN